MGIVHKLSPSFKEHPLNPYMLEEDRFGKPRENPPKIDPRSLFLRYEPRSGKNYDYFGETEKVENGPPIANGYGIVVMHDCS